MFLLIVELIVLSHQKVIPIPTVEIQENHEIIIRGPLMDPGKSMGLPESENGDQTYGIRIRFKDGVIDFYRQERTVEWEQR